MSSPARIGIICRLDRSVELAALENCSSQLKGFARQGGPDLCDLRAVNLAQVVSRLLLTAVPLVS